MYMSLSHKPIDIKILKKDSKYSQEVDPDLVENSVNSVFTF